ncbi:hypothetical protein [Rhizobium leguminosarum]|uniref:hypothetical protein n=1 Tax=Rhizobium leguminosarum TaxID=384 RepID=UPI0012F6C509|nr:hypothetical protein [Rhizobium leguminosarum]
MSSSDTYQISTGRSRDAEPTSSRPAERTPMTPFNVVLLSAVGIILGGAAVLNFSPFGSVGRYQLISGSISGQVIRIDTVTGDLSRCNAHQRKLACEAWTAPDIVGPAPALQTNQ